MESQHKVVKKEYSLENILATLFTLSMRIFVDKM